MSIQDFLSRFKAWLDRDRRHSLPCIVCGDPSVAWVDRGPGGLLCELCAERSSTQQEDKE